MIVYWIDFLYNKKIHRLVNFGYFPKNKKQFFV